MAGVLTSMPRYVDRVLVIDDGSNDATSTVAASVVDARVRVIRHPVRRGVGAAIATGYRAALASSGDGRDAIAVMAGDGQMHPDDLEGVVGPIVDGTADYVKGDRFGEAGVQKAMGFPRWLGGQVFSRLTSLAVGQPISDSQCGFTAIGREMLGALDLDGLWPSFGYPNDILGQLAARRARIHEAAVRPVYGTEISKLRIRHLPPIFFLIARAAARHRGPAVPRVDDNRKRALRDGSAVSS